MSLLLLIVIPVMAIVLQFYSSSRKIVEDQLYLNNQIAVERKASAMNELTARIVRASNLMMNDYDTQKLFRDSANWMDQYPAFVNYQTVMRKLSSIQDMLLESGARVFLYDFRGYLLSPEEGIMRVDLAEMRQYDWFEQVIDKMGFPHWFIEQGPENGKGESTLGMARLLNNVRLNGDGILWVTVSTDVFFYSRDELQEQARNGIYLAIMGSEGWLYGDTQLMAGAAEDIRRKQTDDNGIGRIKIDGQEYLVNETTVSGQPGWSLAQLVDLETYRAPLGEARNRSLLFVLFWFSVFAIAFIGLMFRFTKPLKRLIYAMSRVGLGQLNVEVNVRGRDEMAMLGRYFNRMALQLQSLIAHLSDEQLRKQKAQFQALQAQINPHFLMNTMNSIKWMAILSGSNHVSEMLSKLGKLLNYTMQQQEIIVSIRDELEYLEVYMALQKIRYHDNIELNIDIPEELLDVNIVKFTMQPIVENSIIHGKRFPLAITISAQTDSDKLLLEIRDNGEGMDEETIRRIEAQMEEPHAKFSGIGIRNVNERIKLEFGAEYGVSIDSSAGEGVRTIVTLPYERGDSSVEAVDRRRRNIGANRVEDDYSDGWG